MRALHRKLLRDLWRLRGQVLAIALVMASGVGVLVMSLTTVESLEETAIAYYERYRFGHVFARVERAPAKIQRPASRSFRISVRAVTCPVGPAVDSVKACGCTRP